MLFWRRKLRFWLLIHSPSCEVDLLEYVHFALEPRDTFFGRKQASSLGGRARWAEEDDDSGSDERSGAERPLIVRLSAYQRDGRHRPPRRRRRRRCRMPTSLHRSPVSSSFPPLPSSSLSSPTACFLGTECLAKCGDNNSETNKKGSRSCEATARQGQQLSKSRQKSLTSEYQPFIRTWYNFYATKSI